MLTDKINFTAEQDSSRPGTWFLGRFVFWRTDLRGSIIRLRRIEEKIDYVLRLFNWLVVFIGYAAFGFWLSKNQAEFLINPLGVFFPKTFDPLLFIFFVSLWFDLFLIYSVSRSMSADKKINKRLFTADSKNKSQANNKSGKKYDVATAYSRDSFKIIEDAYILANKLRQSETGVIHLFRVLLKNKEIQNLFIRLDVDAKKLVDLVDHHLLKSSDKKKFGHIDLSESLQELLVSSFVEACNLRQESVDVLNMVSFCCEKDADLGEILYELEIDQSKIDNTVAWFRVNRRLLEKYNNYRRLALLKPGDNMNRAYTAIATPTLDHFGHDLTVEAKAGNLEICIGRTKEINSIFESFTGGHEGVLLVGQNGVGKRTIVNGLAQMMVEENVPAFLKDKRLVELDVSRLIAGADASQAQERLLISLNEIAHSGNIILYINNIETLVGISAGDQESLDVSQVLAESLNRHQLYCLASASTENYTRYIENKALGNAMNAIGLKEPEFNETIQILESKVAVLESKYDIYIVYSALEQAVSMATRYLHDKFLPLKAINLLEKAAIIASKEAKNDPTKCFCGREQVAAAISDLTGIPVSKVSVSESQKLLHLETEIHKRLIGQSEAVDAVAASLRRARAELKDAKRPIASFLFLGPTGVGKTELAKSVSEVYFGDEDYLIRLDMSEYQSADSIKKMIGDVDGSLGYLTEAVRKKPFSLVLLDEIEKANPDILNLFLQMLDDGRLTDGQGRTISFTESIIIATSNIGAVYIQDQIKINTPLNLIKQDLIDNQLNQYMRPELINRFDGIIVFKPLTQEDVFTVATLMLKRIKRSLADKGIGLKADKDGVEILAKEGYDPKFGARPLRRLLQDKVEDVIATKILGGELKRRDSVVINSKAVIEIEKASDL